DLIAAPAVRAALAAALARHNAGAGGSSQRIARALLMDQPPSIDRGEITDKGYLNQRAVLTHRAALVERLHAEAADAAVVLPAARAVRAALAAALARHNAGAGGSSQRIARALLMDQPPSIDRGEITDKGYLNQRAVLTHRAALVERLHAEAADAGIVLPAA